MFVQVIIILYNTARPSVTITTEELDGSEYLLARLDRALVFPSVSYVRNVINKAGLRQGQSRLPVVLDAAHIYTSDYTAAKGFKAMVADFNKRSQPIIFANLKENVERTFLGAVHGNSVFVIVKSDEELRQKLEEIFSGEEMQNGAALMNGGGVNGDLSSPDHVDPLLAGSPEHSAAAGDSIA